MRLIVAGSRTITDAALVVDAVAGSGWTPTVVIEGEAPGVDTLARAWAAGRRTAGSPDRAFVIAAPTAGGAAQHGGRG